MERIVPVTCAAGVTVVSGDGAGDRHVREQLGRVELLQRLVERARVIGNARLKIGVSADRFRLEALVPRDLDRADDPLGGCRGLRHRRCRGLRCRRRRWSGLGLLRRRGHGDAAKDRAHHQQRTTALATVRT